MALAIGAGVTVGTGGVEREGADYRCWADDEVDPLEVTAKLNFVTGSLRGFEGRDHNGLAVRIDSQNSGKFECQSVAGIEAERAKEAKRCRAVLARRKVEGASGEMSLDELTCRARLEIDAQDQ